MTTRSGSSRSTRTRPSTPRPIPGAIGFDWKQDLQDQVKRDFLGPEDFGELMGSRGISNDHTVVLYGDRNNWFAAYTYWYFQYYGHDNVKLVNGPREKWIGEERETSTEVPSYPAATFTAQPGDDAIRAKRDEVSWRRSTPRRLVDVRSPQEYSGELIAMAGYEQEGAQRGGHIPGAASIPWAQAVQEDGTFKSADELPELYGGKGVLDGEPIIAYCRIGERSAHTWFVLHELLGRDDVKNYDGSWTEWGNLVAVPIEKGARRERSILEPLEQVAEDPRGRAPDHVLADLVRRRADRHAAADEAPHPERVPKLVETEHQHRCHLGRVRPQGRLLGDQADDRMDLVPGDERAHGRQRAGDLHDARIEADLLLGLAQRGGDEVRVSGVAAPARERDLAGVAAHVGAALREDQAGALWVAEQRQQHGGVGASRCAQSPRFDGVAAGAR